MTKKILFVTSKSFGGSGKYIECLADGLKEKGFICELIYSRSDVSQDKLIENAFDKVHFFQSQMSMSPISILKNIFKVRSLIKKGNFDWIHSHTSLGGLIGRLGGLFFYNKIKVAHTLHAFGADEFTPIPQKWIYWIIERMLDFMTDIYFCPSNYMKQYGKSIKVLNPNKCRVVHNSLPLPSPPVDPSKVSKKWRSEMNINANDVVYLFCGRIEKQKGVDVLVNAFALVDKTLNFKLVICGQGDDEKEIRNLITKHDLWPNIIWAGWQSNLEPFYCSSDVYIMPSRWESFGLVFLEAMNHSLPIISTSVQAIPEVVTDGEVGILSRSEDEVILAENIELMIKDSGLRLKLGIAGNKRVNSIFSYEQFVTGHSKVYESST